MPARNYDNWLQEYLRYTEQSEAPDVFHFWTGVAVIAGALRRRVWIDQRYFQWTPNFYIVFVAPPGIATKSTSMGVGMRLLREVEGVHFGPNSLTWQGLTLALEEARDHVQLAEDIFQPMSCLTCALSELGTFLKPKDTDLIDLLVDLWDGQITPWRHKTRTTGEATIQNPWMNIIGCTTPAWLRGNFPTYIIEGGLTSRIVFVFADEKRQFVPYPADTINQGKFQAHSQRLIDDLRQIGELVGEYEMTKEAKVWGAEWYRNHWRTRPPTMISERFGGYLARKQTHIHKLAIVIAASKRNELYISHEDLQEANSIVTPLEAHLMKVFQVVGAHDSSRLSGEILAHIRAYGEISLQKLTQIFLGQADAKSIDSILTGLQQAGYIEKTMILADGLALTGFAAVPQPPEPVSAASG